MDPRPIGVFDSGVGGLTVARVLIDLLPTESVVYYGDTGRAPYGPRTREEVHRFSKEIADILVAEGVKMLVVACNAMSSAGINHIRDAYPDLPVIEVWEPCARAAVKTTRNGRIGVIGTPITIESRMYEWAITATRANVGVSSVACPAFVELVERGQTTGDEVVSLANEYLEPLRSAEVDTLILGCTHYPLLRAVIGYVMGPDVVLIESGREVAIDVFAELTRRDAFRSRAEPPAHRFLCSGDPELFARLGQKFLGPEIAKVEERPWS